MFPRLLSIGIFIFAVVTGVAGTSIGAVAPGSNFDLSHWKLTLPLDDFGGITGEATEIKQPILNTYASQFFYTDADGAMVFWCPVIGAKTTSATAPRTELRELIDGRDSKVNWSVNGTHILRGRCRVTQLPDTGAVIIGQVHGYPAQRLVKLQYDNGRVQAYVRNSFTDGGDTKFTWAVSSSAPVDYEIKVIDGVAIITVNGVTNSHDFLKTDPDWGTITYYFKAGAYLQDSSGPETEGGRVSFYQLSVSHGTPVVPPSITSQPFGQTVAAGGTVALTVAAAGGLPFQYQWRANGTPIPGSTGNSLVLTGFRSTDQNTYDVVISNPGGSVTSSAAPLYLNAPLRFVNSRPMGSRFNALLLGVTGSNYVLQTSTNLIHWTPIATNGSASGIVNFSATNMAGGQRYYRAR